MPDPVNSLPRGITAWCRGARLVEFASVGLGCAAEVAIPRGKPRLPDDDFRRAHDNFWRAHNHYRRPDDDFVAMLVSRVIAPAPPAIRDEASGGGKEAGNGE